MDQHVNLPLWQIRLQVFRIKDGRTIDAIYFCRAKNESVCQAIADALLEERYPSKSKLGGSSLSPVLQKHESLFVHKRVDLYEYEYFQRHELEVNPTILVAGLNI